jgi:thioredoxin 1
MKQSALEYKLRKNTRPVVVEFWAPWCSPCKMMAPYLKKAEKEFSGRVDLWRINADEEQNLVRAMGVRGIPTMVGYYQGQEISRRTGAMTAENVMRFFEAVEQQKPFTKTLSWVERLIRIVPALVILILGWINGPNYWLMVLGAVILFSAFYDRCPVCKVVSQQIRELFKKKQPN